MGLAPSAVFERIRKLEERGVIQGYMARVNPKAVDLPLLAYIFVRDNEGPEAKRPREGRGESRSVLEVHQVAGEDCFLAKVRAADTERCGRLLRERIGAIKTIESTRTTIVLDTIKEIVGASDRTARPLRGAGSCLNAAP